MTIKQNRLKKGFSIALLFISSFSVLLNIFLYFQLRKYYTMLYAVELDPLGLSVFEDANPPKADENLQRIVFYGDSRAAQWPNPKVQGYDFLNRGIGNQTTSQVLLRFDTDVVPLKPDVILLQVGINDLKTIPLFPGGRENIVSNCKENIQQMIENSRRQRATVLLSTIFPTGQVPLQRRLVWSDEIEAAIVEVNAYIKSLAADDVIVFDAAKILSDFSGKLKPEYSYDELHLNQAGYDVLNAELPNLLKKLKDNAP